ncbi:patatin-like phospholipase family protein [Natronospirillum operosum]|uniref:patatin-like phospholipase family protein n=1 Tax=Natronospirillum operosum TaxID=2759953 RepID=UPI00197BFE17|nr:patatin-like phospholipase family protein [Natronospirillum operosum]
MAKLTWVEVAAGETLMVQGDPGDAMYMAVSGRLRVYVAGENGKLMAVQELGRGQVIGEMSLFTGEPRSATVVAIRDSVLVRLDKEHFEELLSSSNQVSLALTRQIIQRLRAQNQTNPMPTPVTIAVLPVTPDVVPRRFADDLARHLGAKGSVAVVDADVLDMALGAPGSANGDNSNTDLNHRISMYLDLLEAEHDFVLLVGDATPSEWTHRCARHSDEMLLLADTRHPPVLHPIETDCLDQLPEHLEAAEILVLVHPEGTHSPRGTQEWLARRPVTDHVHVRSGLDRDMARLARIESRTAVGLVLAGGGARGFSHLGVFRALQERGIEVDFVGGTSIGAIMASLLAPDQPLERVMDIGRRAFHQNPTGDYNWLPMMSLISGRRLKRIIEQALHELHGFAPNIEDNWKNYYCVTTNYSRAREQVLRHGSMAKALLATTAIPGALPPMVMGGDLVCDGGTFNNFPVDVMRQQRGVGRVIGVDLNSRKSHLLEFEEVPPTATLLRDRFRARTKRHYRLPSMVSYLMNVTILYSSSRQRHAQEQTDLYFNPPLNRVGLLQWRRFDEIVQLGYEHAVAVLDGAETNEEEQPGGQKATPAQPEFTKNAWQSAT